MTHKVLPKTDLPKLVRKWMQHSAVYAPVHEGDLIEFQPLNDPDEMVIDAAANTRYPPKAAFLPQSEAMFRVQGDKFVSTENETEPRIILGIHPCDVRALQLLDTVFLTEDNQDPYWANKRQRTTIVALGCSAPAETCFCTTVGSGPFDIRGSDLMLTEADSSYVIEVLTEKGQRLVSHLQDAPQAVVDTAVAKQTTVAESMTKAFDSTGIRDKLYGLFDSDFWQTVQESCLGCGVCTFLCPTCYCFDIVDEGQRNERVRNWDSCMFRVYSQEASGHNPRPTNKERTRQRVMHKYAYWLDQIGEIGCTGCGRCVRYCPVNLDIRDIIRRAQAWKEA